MKEKDKIYFIIDMIRKSDVGNELITKRICNYIETNIDEFIECYEDEK
jgi:hypothetical protein